MIDGRASCVPFTGGGGAVYRLYMQPQPCPAAPAFPFLHLPLPNIVSAGIWEIEQFPFPSS